MPTGFKNDVLFARFLFHAKKSFLSGFRPLQYLDLDLVALWDRPYEITSAFLPPAAS